ncbi:MAG TPA: rhodanese-like domain-containing protein [Bacteroidia bacterium]|nr:rhodanese-like domain-containing protein [Bacteroidia bacterium]
MKKIILSFLLFSFGIFGISSAEVKPFEALELADFKKEIKNSIVIDIRTPGEIILGKITKDALEMDFYEEKKFKEDLNKLDKTKQYLIYCRSGNRSDSTKSIMKDLGFSNVNDLDGGIII